MNIILKNFRCVNTPIDTYQAQDNFLTTVK